MTVETKEVTSTNYVLELTQDEADTLYDAISCALDEWQNNLDHCYDFEGEGCVRFLQELKEALL